MNLKKRNQRRPIKANAESVSLSPKAKKLVSAFEAFDSTDEQVRVFARLAKIVADALEEDRVDHALMDRRQHELAELVPLEQVSRELAREKTRKPGRRR